MFLFVIRANRGNDFTRRNAVLSNRELMGATNPKDAKENILEICMEYRLIKIQCMAQTQMIMQRNRIFFRISQLRKILIIDAGKIEYSSF